MITDRDRDRSGILLLKLHADGRKELRIAKDTAECPTVRPNNLKIALKLLHLDYIFNQRNGQITLKLYLRTRQNLL